MKAAARVNIEAVATVIREVAEEVIMPRWQNLASHEIGSKTRPDDIVTIADHEAEALLTRRLGDMLPGSRVVGEEAVAADPGVLELFRGSDPVWVIDPIDGTRKFAEGQPTFDVLVSLVVAGRGQAGWIYAPAEQNLYMGERGSGVAHRNNEGINRPVRRQPAQSLLELEGILNARPFSMRGFVSPDLIRDRFRSYSKPTCAGHNYARLLSGESDFLINFSTLPWDHFAGLTLAAVAGFHAARHDGQAFDPLDTKGGLLVAPDSDSWHEILAMLLRPQ